MKIITLCLLPIALLGGLAATLSADTFQAGDVVYGTNQGDTVEWYRNGVQVADLQPAPSNVAAFVAFDKSGDLYVTQQGTVGKFDTHGDFLGTFATTASGQWGGLVFNNAGDLFAGTTNGSLSAGSGIFEFNSAGSLIKNYLPGTVSYGLGLEANQNVLLFIDQTDIVHSLNLITGVEGTFATTAAGSGDNGLAILPDGDVLVAGFTSNEVYLLNSSGVLLKQFSVSDPDGLALDPSGTSFWAANYSESTVSEYSLANGSFEQKIGGLDDRAAGVAIYAGPQAAAIPEPSSLALLTLAIAGILVVRRFSRSLAGTK